MRCGFIALVAGQSNFTRFSSAGELHCPAFVYTAQSDRRK
ncbi:hypothetical protein CFter6_4079 [Collimonas fungivorans]|uniref:Uncharacterized protein n=1 Tax=Collimonas fungivorans TaxID=158899 RepID=A0A127PFX3_9BURK|nr:hypothetical protein CFter6_4079 [Collimonas fungivorans]